MSDQRMPNMTGAEFLSRVRVMYPDTIRIILSGYTDLKAVTEVVNRGKYTNSWINLGTTRRCWKPCAKRFGNMEHGGVPGWRNLIMSE